MLYLRIEFPRFDPTVGRNPRTAITLLPRQLVILSDESHLEGAPGVNQHSEDDAPVGQALVHVLGDVDAVAEQSVPEEKEDSRGLNLERVFCLFTFWWRSASRSARCFPRPRGCLWRGT